MIESHAQIAADIEARIQSLSSMNEESLKDEMASLKRALLANPEACMLLREENIGLLVESLRRITKKELTVASSSAKKPKEKQVQLKLTPEQLNEALNSDEF